MAPNIATVITRILKDWSLPKGLCVRLLSDSGSNMIAAGDKLGIKHMACIAHSLHLVVDGSVIKKSKTDDNVSKPAWAEDVAAECAEAVAEHEEESALSREERGTLEYLHAFSIGEMKTFLDDVISGWHRSEVSALREIVQHFRCLAVYFRKSPKGNNQLGAIQIQHCNVKSYRVLRPIVDCHTHWNSTWEMLLRLITLEKALVKVFFAYLKISEGRKEFQDMEKKLRRPKPDEWLAIKCLQLLLGSFAVASSELGGQTSPMAPLVLPALSGIRKHLERTDLFDAHVGEAGDEDYVHEIEIMMNEYRKAMLAMYTKRFRALEESELKWVSFLDTRVAKRMSHRSPTDTPSAWKEVVKAMVDWLETICRVKIARPLLQFLFKQTSRCDFPCMITCLVLTKFLHTRPSWKKTAVKYLAAVTTVKSATNPFVRWRVNTSSYPNLGRLAMKWLGNVATNVPSESPFSTSGNIVTVKRSWLSPCMVRDLGFIAENWQPGHQ